MRKPSGCSSILFSLPRSQRSISSAPGSRGTVYADEAGAWNELHGRFTMHRINHQEAYSLDGDIYTNNAESFFSRMRRAEIGHHHHLAGPYLARFAQASAWREDHR